MLSNKHEEQFHELKRCPFCSSFPSIDHIGVFFFYIIFLQNVQHVFLICRKKPLFHVGIRDIQINFPYRLIMPKTERASSLFPPRHRNSLAYGQEQAMRKVVKDRSYVIVSITF
jgi:hypothetical protein